MKYYEAIREKLRNKFDIRLKMVKMEENRRVDQKEHGEKVIPAIQRKGIEWIKRSNETFKNLENRCERTEGYRTIFMVLHTATTLPMPLYLQATFLIISRSIE